MLLAQGFSFECDSCEDIYKIHLLGATLNEGDPVNEMHICQTCTEDMINEESLD